MTKIDDSCLFNLPKKVSAQNLNSLFKPSYISSNVSSKNWCLIQQNYVPYYPMFTIIAQPYWKMYGGGDCHSLTHLLTHSLTHSLTQSLTHSLVHSLTYLLIYLLAYLFACLLTYLLTYFLACLLTLLTYLFTSFLPSFLHSLLTN